MIHWFKRHPKYLVTESESLSNDSNYKELFQVRDNLFVSHGNIIVRLNKIYHFPILIVYPESTPYVLPSIFPLKQALTKEQVEFIAVSSFENILHFIERYVEYYYHLRHQNQSGILCILEWDNLDDGAKFYGIKTILKRVRDWFKGTITGEFPPDSQEVEFHSHFTNVANNIQLLYPEKFLNESITEGESYSLLFNYVAKGKFYHTERRTFFGCLLNGIGKNGLYESVNYDLPHFFIEEGINTTVELFGKKEIIKKLINEGRLLRSPWFQLNTEPTPFKTFNDFVEIVGEGNFDQGVQRMLPFFKEECVEKPDIIFISIRFPNRKGLQEFQLFRALKKPEISGALIGVSEVEAFKHFIDSYLLIEAVRCEKFTDESYHLRNASRANRLILIEKSVNIVGVGALGSEIADIVAKAGVGCVSLFDNQLIHAPNPIRHLAGLDQIGFAKVEAVARIITDHNPFIKIHVDGRDINSLDLNEIFKDDSVTISSIAEDNIEGFLNERAVISNKIVYYTRALRGGKVARIFRVIPGIDACFHCLELYRKDGTELIDIPEDELLPTLKNECNNPIRPASAADLKLISSLSSRIVIDELQGGFGDKNHWVWSTEKIKSLEPFQLASQTIKPHPKCYYCNHEKKVNIFLPNSIQKEMRALIAEDPKIETGGVLAGYIDEEGNFNITNASSPGPKAIKLATNFEKDVEFCQAFLDKLFVESNKQIIYIGEWHSHPNERNQPSGTDIKSLTDIAFQKEYLTDIPLMIIFSNKGIPSCTIHPAGKLFYQAILSITDK